MAEPAALRPGPLGWNQEVTGVLGITLKKTGFSCTWERYRLPGVPGSCWPPCRHWGVGPALLCWAAGPLGPALLCVEGLILAFSVLLCRKEPSLLYF